VRIACGRWAGTAVPAIVATVAVRPGRWCARHGPLSGAGSCRPLPDRQSGTTPTDRGPRDGVTVAGSEVCYQHLGTRHRQPHTPTPRTSARYHSLPLTIAPAAANPGESCQSSLHLDTSRCTTTLTVLMAACSAGRISEWSVWSACNSLGGSRRHGCRFHWPQSWARTSLTSTCSPPTTGPGFDAVLTTRW
jgi:hypothetical protein